MKLKPNQKSQANLIYKCSRCGNLHALMKGETASACEICHEDGESQTWLPTSRELLIVAKDVRKEAERDRTVLDRITDGITDFCGSMPFVYLHVIWFAGWIIYNLKADEPFDPFPFGLLTLIVSLEAILLATFIMISQNRQVEISEMRSKLDYQIDRKAEKTTAEILALLKRIYDKTIVEEEQGE